MLNYNIDLRFDIVDINKQFYHFKSRYDFEDEFSYNNGIILGEGTFGLVKKCKRNMIKNNMLLNI